MNIDKLNKNTGFITLTLSEEELRTITNLMCKARKSIGFSKQDYKINADLFAAITLLHHGIIPDFELKHLTELYHKASQEEVKND